MDFGLGEKAEAFRLEVRAFLAEHMNDEIRDRAWRTGTLHDWNFHRALAERRWIAPGWPVSFGGQGRDEFEVVAMNEELALAGSPVDGMRTTMLVVETLRHVGTVEQQEAIIPRVLSGEILICLGYSEPDSGSDVAAAKSTAVRDGDEWVINGQKMFTSIAHEAAFVFFLARTDPKAPKHKGLTMFLLPMDAEGVEVVPIHTLGGQLTNVTFYNDIRVPDSARIGEVNAGWHVMTVGLAIERTVPLGPGPVLARIVSWAARQPRGADNLLDDPKVRLALTRATISSQVSTLLFRRSVWIAAQGEIPAVEGSMAKLFGSEAYNRDFAAVLDAIGPASLLQGDQTGAIARGELEHAFRYAPFLAIGGGASEIQREIIAHRGLGLPRSR
jgi:alkylation response protein AidB-like acyl-CoA dehydrogenase